MIKAVVFDVDGVLIDSNDTIIKAYQRTAVKLRLRIPSSQEILILMGRPLEEIAGILWPDSDIAMYTKEYRRMFLDKDLIIPKIEGAPDAVRNIKKSGFSVGVVSGKRRFFIIKHLKEAGFDINLFEVIVSFETTKKHKPDPEPLLHAIKKLHVKTVETMYVGDAVSDYKCAESAGVEYVAVLTGCLGRVELEQLGVKNMIGSVVDLPDFMRVRSIFNSKRKIQ